MQKMKRLLVGVVVLMAPFACAVDANDDVEPTPLCQGEFDEFELGIVKSVGDFEVTLLNANPSPPVEGFNRWTISITESGEPREDLQPTFQPWMPEHGHGANVPVNSELSGSDYESLDLDFFMPGRWETTVAFEGESVIFAFCVN